MYTDPPTPFNRRRVLSSAGAVLAASVAAPAAWAQANTAAAWPSRPVRIVVPFAASGPADNYARFVAQRLQDALGQSFVVDNRPGGGGVIGTDFAAKAAPDGYTLMVMSNAHTVNESLIPTKPYNLVRDFVPIAPINSSDLVLVANPAVPANTLREFMALAKAKPGKFNYASSGPGTPYHMAGELFKAMAGLFIVHVPYKGSAAARTDVVGGQVDVMFDAVTTMAEFVKAGKVKALATTGKTRSAALPDVPTMDEAGLKGYESTIWLGLMAPKGTPDAVVTRLNEEVSKMGNNPQVRQAWARQGAVPLVQSPAEFGRYVQADIVKWEKIVKFSGAKAGE